MKTLRLGPQWAAIAASIGITALIVLLLAAFSIVILDEYGFVLFMLVPFCLGLTSTLIYNYSGKRTFKASLSVSFYSLLLVCAGIIAIKIEGMLCVVMASPFVTLFMVLGTFIGHHIGTGKRGTVVRVLSFDILAIPLMMGIESKIVRDTPDLIKVSTSIVIAAPIATVWENVIVFPPMDKPDELIFKTGIAYPRASTIVGTGEGAIRYCEFITGRFVEPITVWDAPHTLRFTVQEQPAPLKDMLREDVPENMVKYFVSTRGEFQLRTTDTGSTLLEGSTWYYHKIQPVAYWQLWSAFIVHSIHARVLGHIKKVSEQKNIKK